MKQIKFNKEDDGRWFADIDTWQGSKDALEMVAGADTFLDLLLDYGESSVILDVSDSPVDDWLCLDLICNHGDGCGATYVINEHVLWLCDVTIHVLGYFPENIYFNVIRV